MKVALFVPCYVDAFFPEVGIATLELLERLGCEVDFPLDQTCCGQPMANSGCHADAHGAEALFAKNFAGYDHIVTPSGSCAHHVRDHMTAIEQTAAVQKVRRNTHELVEFLHDVLQVREFPVGGVPAQGRPAHRLRDLARPARSQHLRDRRAGLQQAEAAAVRRQGHRVRRTEARRRMLRLRRHLLGLRGTGLREDGPRQGRGYHQAGAEYIVSPDMSCVMHQQGCARRAGPAAQVHPHRAGAQRGTGMTRVDHAEASSKFIEAKDHADFHDKRLWDLRKKRDSESEAMPEWETLRTQASAIKEHTLTHLGDYLEEFEKNATANGMVVHWARDAAEHNQIVHGNPRAARRDDAGQEQIDADRRVRDAALPRQPRHRGRRDRTSGERIQQLDDEPPSHIVVPAVTSCAATWRKCSPTTSAPTARTTTCPTSRKASGSTRGRTT
jgi:L-lactate dehydrogenase complex protein LldE